MAKMKKVAENTYEVTLGDEKKPSSIRIIDAKINDEFCNYSYEIIEGVGKGQIHAVKGKGCIIDPDLGTALSKFMPHLAAIDDMFKHAGVKVKNIEGMQNDDLTLLFEATGFTIKGAPENESIIIHGTKFVSTAGGRIEFKTPQIPLTGAPSYPWYNELKEASDNARQEVQLYHEGKYTPEKEEIEEDKAQLGLYDAGKSDEEFENAKVK